MGDFILTIIASFIGAGTAFWVSEAYHARKDWNITFSDRFKDNP